MSYRGDVGLRIVQMPTEANLDYIVAPPPAGTTSSESESIVVFCVDVSGSMCVSQPVHGNVKLRYVQCVWTCRVVCPALPQRAFTL